MLSHSLTEIRALKAKRKFNKQFKATEMVNAHFFETTLLKSNIYFFYFLMPKKYIDRELNEIQIYSLITEKIFIAFC